MTANASPRLAPGAARLSQYAPRHEIGKSVWAYFNNDGEAAAIHDALPFKAMMRQLTAG